MSGHGFTLQVGGTYDLAIAPSQRLAKKLILNRFPLTEKAVPIGVTDDLVELRAYDKEISLSEQAVYPYSALTSVVHRRH